MIVRSLGILAVCLLALLAGCASSGSAADAAERAEIRARAVHGMDNFLTYLDSRSLRTLEANRTVNVRELSSSATAVYTVTLDVYPGVLYVYEYESEADARADSRRLDFGSLLKVRAGAANFRGQHHPMVTSQNAPVYQGGKLVVAYLGQHVLVQSVLHDAMGAPIR